MRINTRAALAAAVALGWSAAAWADGAVVGTAAPDFTLNDTTGQPRSPAQVKGRFLVLEWNNPECPFVHKHYDSDNMQRLQRAMTAKGVVWWTVNSSAPGKQGHVSPEQAAAITKARGAAPTAVLLDADGAVGRRYGAKTTPNMFVINSDGVVIYAGAIDDRPSTDPADVEGAVNYVQRALDEAMAGKPVSVPQTRPYGCSVKY